MWSVFDGLDKYKCHKEVWAAKISNITGETDGDGNTISCSIFFENGNSKNIDNEYIERHQPQIGGYYVVYADGYKSYSPQKPFEEGYTKAE